MKKMIEVTRKEFERLRVQGNNVMLKPKRATSDDRIDGLTSKIAEKVFNEGEHNEVRIWLDISHNVGMHAPVFCEVMKVPEKLFFKPGSMHSMPWKTNMQTLPGDNVVVHYLAMSNALCLEYEADEDSIIMCEGELYVIVRYEDLYAASRGEEVIPLNGFVLCEPVEKNVKEYDGIIRPDVKVSEKLARVKYVGELNSAYSMPHQEGWDDRRCELSVGDLIAYEVGCDLVCEYEVHSAFLGGEKLFRIQPRNIVAIVPESIVELD